MSCSDHRGHQRRRAPARAGSGFMEDQHKSRKVNIILFPGQQHLRLSGSWAEASPVEGPARCRCEESASSSYK